MEVLKPEPQFHGGQSGQDFKVLLKEKLKDYPEKKFILDLSEVVFMDTYTFRLVFDNLPKFNEIIPPKDSWVIDRYDEWLDSKKGLSK